MICGFMYFWGDFDTDLTWIAKFIPGDRSYPEFEDRTYSFTDIPKRAMNFRMTEEEAEYYKTELYRQVMEKARKYEERTGGTFVQLSYEDFVAEKMHYRIKHENGPGETSRCYISNETILNYTVPVNSGCGDHGHLFAEVDILIHDAAGK